MTKFDTVHFRTQVENLSFNQNRFVKSTTSSFDDTSSSSTKFICSVTKSDTGITSIYINPETNEVKVRCSAKLLQGNYLQGINVNTFEQFLCKFNELDIVSLKLNELNNAQILSCDATENIIVDSPRASIEALKLGKSNRKFRHTDYNSCKNNGIVFVGHRQNKPPRQIYYNKIVELQQAKNKFILEKVQDYSDLFSMLRVERNFRDFAGMRKAFKIRKKDDGILFKDILNSKEKPVYSLHREITENACNVTLFDMYDGIKFVDVILDIGFTGIYVQCNSDADLARDFIKNSKDSRATRYRNIAKFNIWLPNYLARKQETPQKYIDTLKEIGELLKVA